MLSDGTWKWLQIVWEVETAGCPAQLLQMAELPESLPHALVGNTTLVSLNYIFSISLIAAVIFLIVCFKFANSCGREYHPSGTLQWR